MNIITKDPMNYKTYLKNNEEITIKLRIIKHRIIDKEATKGYGLKTHRFGNGLKVLFLSNLYSKIKLFSISKFDGVLWCSK